MPLRALVFDGEGVVIDTEGAWDHSQEVFMARRGHPYDRSEVKPLLTGRGLSEGTEVLRKRFGLTEAAESLSRERLELMTRFFESEVDFIPGFKEFYGRVSGQYKTALATALDPHLLRLADYKLGLHRLFGGAIVSLADVGYRGKPFPDLFLRAAEILKVDAGECVVVEDSPLGIEAAGRAGMLSIGLATTYPRAALRGATMVVRSYSEIELREVQALSARTVRPASP